MIDRRTEGFLYLVAFIACIPIANWMIGNVGTTCIPNGPCLVPVAPRLMAPSGVLMIGLALVLRDLVQRRLGRSWSLGRHCSWRHSFGRHCSPVAGHCFYRRIFLLRTRRFPGLYPASEPALRYRSRRKQHGRPRR